jgi:autotransporter-associated beta strand protein
VYQLVANSSGGGPVININGPGAVNLGGLVGQQGVTANSAGVANTGTGLIVNAMTTINQTGLGTLYIGTPQNTSNAALAGVGVAGPGGFIINGSPYSITAFGSPTTGAYQSNFSGGVTLNSGILEIGTGSNSTALEGPVLGTGTLTINGGVVTSVPGAASTSAPIATLPNPVTLNGSNITFTTGTLNFSGVISGTTGTEGLHLTVGRSSASGPDSVILSGADTYSGPTVLDNAPVLKYSSTYASNINANLVIAPTGSIYNTSSISVGSYATLSLNANANDLGIPSTAPLSLTNASLSIYPDNITQTYNVTSGTFSGNNVLTFQNNLGNTNTANTVNFSTPTYVSGDKPTLFFHGEWNSTTGVNSTVGQAFIGGGLPTATDANYLGSYPVVASASGGSNVSGTAATAFISYSPTAGVILVPFTDTNNVTQFLPAGGTGGQATANQFTASYFSSGTDDRLLNLYNWSGGVSTGFYTTYNLSGTATVYALSATWAATIKGGSLNVTSGEIVTGQASGSNIAGSITFNSSNVTLGNATTPGYIHTGSVTVTAGSTITAADGLVIDGEGSNAGTVTFSSTANTTTANLISGGIFVEGGGVLAYANDLSLGPVYNAATSLTTGTITLNGGSLENSTSTTATLSRPIILGAGGGGVFPNYSVGGATLTVSSSVSGSGAFYLVSPSISNTLVLSGNNTYTGGTYLYAGTLSVGSDANLGGTNAGPVYFVNNNTLIFNAAATFNTPFVFWNSGTFNTSGNNVTIASPITNIGPSTNLVTKIGLGTLSWTAASPNFEADITVSAGTLSLSGNGTLPELSYINNIASGATFQIDNTASNNNDRFPDQAKISMNGGTFNYIGNAAVPSSETFGSLALTSSSTVNVTPASATLTSGNVLSGTGTLIKTGPGTFVIGTTVVPGLPSTSFTGGTNVSGGTLKLTSSSSLGFGDPTKNTAPGSSLVAGGAMDLNGQTITEPITLNGGSLINSNASSPATLTSGIKAQVLSAAPPTAGIGTGYSPGDYITEAGANGATEALALGLTNASYNNPSFNFANATGATVTLVGGGGTGAAATLTINNATGAGTFNISSAGTGYTSVPIPVVTLTFGNGGSDPVPTFTYNQSAFTVTGVIPTAAGSGYNNSTALAIHATGTGLTAANFSSPVASSLAIVGVNTVGGAGNITINPGITGTTGSLVKTGADTVTLNGAGNYTGGTIINSGTLADYNVLGAGSGPIQLSGGTLALLAPESISNNVNAPSGVSSISIAVGAATNASIGKLNISSGATVQLAATGTGTPRAVLSASGLSVGGLLDVQNNGLDVPASVGLSTVTASVKSGYAGGSWQGSAGITSSTAAADTTYLTALGVITNDNGSGSPLYGPGGTLSSTFDGAAAAHNDVLVKLTYYGDTNLDGVVNGLDYTNIDNGYLNGLSGWANGDFNYDGSINGSDYTLIDNAFNTQGASLAASIAEPSAVATAQIASGSSAVPEPASLGLLASGAMLLGRRSRRR